MINFVICPICRSNIISVFYYCITKYIVSFNLKILHPVYRTQPLCINLIENLILEILDQVNQFENNILNLVIEVLLYNLNI